MVKKTNRIYHKKRPMWTMDNVALFTMRDRKIRCCNNPTVLLNLPAYNALVENHYGLNNTRYEKIMVKLHNPKSKEDIRAVKKAFRAAMTSD